MSIAEVVVAIYFFFYSLSACAASSLSASIFSELLATFGFELKIPNGYKLIEAFLAYNLDYILDAGPVSTDLLIRSSFPFA